MDRRIRFVAALLTVWVLLVAGKAWYFQDARAEAVASWEPGTGNSKIRNPFRIFQECRWQRGPILSADGQTMAESVLKPDGKRCLYERTYPTKDLVPHVVGQWSLHFGKSGLEDFYNSDLIGDAIPAANVSELFSARPRVGRTLVSTIDTRMQQAAVDALAGRRGGVVALNPTTGAVILAASTPSYDPNMLSSNDRNLALKGRCALGDGVVRDDSGTAQKSPTGEFIPCKNPSNPFLSLALQAARPPGSTFKVVTAAAALESGDITPSSPRYPTLAGYSPPGSVVSGDTVNNYGGGSCGGSLSDALRVSCNTTFARIAVDVGSDQLLATAQAMGLDRVGNTSYEGCGAALRSELANAIPGCVPAKVNSQELATPVWRAKAGIGQWQILTSPFGMAIVAGTVANGGYVPRPRFADKVLNRDGSLQKEVRTGIGLQALSPKTAEQLSAMMQRVVEAGTAARAFSGGGVDVGGHHITVAGKTGTAEQSCGSADRAIFGPVKCSIDFPHAWFVAFAPARNPTIAIAVLIERGGGLRGATGGATAAPVARQILEKYFELYPPVA